ncbi:hypothetical protein K438DRAFT_1757992 [Mycena galopus ATCC 62051]|nr:hypothetical protein K438DRAFT_1757992 [Mycena galopus ATCC 62051]
MSPTPHHLQPILALTLDSPMDPHALCVHALYAAVVQLVMCGPGLPYQVPFLRSAMKFMATPRSATHHAQLRERLFSCRCNLVNPEIYLLHHAPPPGVTLADIFELMLFQLCKALAIALEVFQPLAHDASKRWPTVKKAANDYAVPKDINPFGVPIDQLCATLLKWAEDPPSGYAAFTLIGAMAWFARDFETLVLATPRALKLATAHLEYTLDNIPKQHADNLWAARVSGPIYACASNLFFSLWRNRLGVVDHILNYGGIQNRMHAVARRMPSLLQSDGTGDVHDSSAWFTAVCARWGEKFVPRGDPEPMVVNVDRGYLPNAWGLMVAMRCSKCTRAGCRSETPSQASRACAKCGVARYCSTEHQREAWKAEHRPHKAVCAAILTLRSAIHMENTEDWTRLIHDTDAGRAPYTFIGLCKEYKVDPSLGKAILLAAGYAR